MWAIILFMSQFFLPSIYSPEILQSAPILLLLTTRDVPHSVCMDWAPGHMTDLAALYRRIYRRYEGAPCLSKFLPWLAVRTKIRAPSILSEFSRLICFARRSIQADIETSSPDRWILFTGSLDEVEICLNKAQCTLRDVICTTTTHQLISRKALIILVSNAWGSANKWDAYLKALIHSLVFICTIEYLRRMTRLNIE